jgi:hypothetical protein
MRPSVIVYVGFRSPGKFSRQRDTEGKKIEMSHPLPEAHAKPWRSITSTTVVSRKQYLVVLNAMMRVDPDIVHTVKCKVERMEGVVCWNRPNRRPWPDQLKAEGEDRSG